MHGTCYYIIFDEWKNILMYTVYLVVLKQNTPMVRKNLFWGQIGGGGGGQQVFSSRQGVGGGEKTFIAAYGEQMFLQHMFPTSGAPWW